MHPVYLAATKNQVLQLKIRRVGRHTPAGAISQRGKRLPKWLKDTYESLHKQLTTKRGAAYGVLARRVAVGGYVRSKRTKRVSAWRQDGIKSTLALLQAFLNETDLQTGRVGKIVGNQRIHKPISAYATLAGVSEATAERAAVVLRLAGFLKVEAAPRKRVDGGAWRAEAGRYCLNLEQLSKLAGTLHILKSCRKFKIEREDSILSNMKWAMKRAKRNALYAGATRAEAHEEALLVARLRTAASIEAMRKTSIF